MTIEKPVQQALIAGVILGVVCAGIVWYLERFEAKKLHAEMAEYLERHDQFKEFLAKRERGEA